MFAEQPVEPAVEEPALEEPVVQPVFHEHDGGQDAAEFTIREAAAAAGLDPSLADGDQLIEDSPVFEIVAEPDAGLQAQADLGTDEDLEKYIELDLSEFLDEAAPVVTDAVAYQSAEETDEGAAPGWTEAANLAPADETSETAAAEPASVEPEEDDWLEVVAALRRDVERLDATPAAAKMAKPLKKLPRKGPKGKPIQDEWGFFDPEQCGFAALLAKLDEITRADDPARRRKRA
jgi:hypothetical protein